MSIVEEEVTALVSPAIEIHPVEPVETLKTYDSFEGRTVAAPTVRGETVFINPRREAISIKGIKSATPIGRVRLALVGQGGIVESEMTAATIPQQ